MFLSSIEGAKHKLCNWTDMDSNQFTQNQTIYYVILTNYIPFLWLVFLICRRDTIIIDIYSLLSTLTYQKHSFVKIEDSSLDFNALVIDTYILCSLVTSGGKRLWRQTTMIELNNLPNITANLMEKNCKQQTKLNVSFNYINLHNDRAFNLVVLYHCED